MNRRTIKRIRALLIVCILVLSLLLFFYWENNSLTVSRSSYQNDKLPPAFDGFTIVQLSDLQSKRFGKEQKPLLEQVAALSPDVIFLTGDLIDRRHYDLEASMELADGAVALAPTYFVPGNHEALSEHYGELRGRLLDAGVQVLENDYVRLDREGAEICLLGLTDPLYRSDAIPTTGQALVAAKKTGLFEIVLAHRPEIFDTYVKYTCDLIFTGHAHGGQFRLPFIGGLYAPAQGFFPAYTSGSYTEGDSTMYVSRGLGNSLMPIRLFNRPEIVVVTLRSGE